MDKKQELVMLINQILSYFETQAQYDGVEKTIYNYYKKVLERCNELDFKDIGVYNWPRAYLETNSDWTNPILDTMLKANKLIEYFK